MGDYKWSPGTSQQEECMNTPPADSHINLSCSYSKPIPLMWLEWRLVKSKALPCLFPSKFIHEQLSRDKSFLLQHGVLWSIWQLSVFGLALWIQNPSSKGSLTSDIQKQLLAQMHGIRVKTKKHTSRLITCIKSSDMNYVTVLGKS